jgi:hypothetical protein
MSLTAGWGCWPFIWRYWGRTIEFICFKEARGRASSPAESNLYYWFWVGEGTLPLHHLIAQNTPNKKNWNTELIRNQSGPVKEYIFNQSFYTWKTIVNRGINIGNISLFCPINQAKYFLISLNKYHVNQTKYFLIFCNKYYVYKQNVFLFCQINITSIKQNISLFFSKNITSIIDVLLINCFLRNQRWYMLKWISDLFDRLKIRE